MNPINAIIRTLANCVLICLLVIWFNAANSLGDQDSDLFYLKNLSISQLSSLEVTTVSKQEEKMADADAAIYVITSEDIRRSGITSIPELLRMVPGMQVAHIDANKWAISSRGFNAWYANKLLVLMDGRSIYTPLFSGVYWDSQDTLLDDIDRIEVIRGPGATLWGANAVNGVINIITKNAKDTQGGLLKAGGGNLEQGFGALRYGGRIGENGWYRAYAKYFNRDGFKTSTGHDSKDEWDMGRAGFRMDLEPSLKDGFTLQGDIFTGKTHDRFKTTIGLPDKLLNGKVSSDLNGGNILGRWHHHLSKDSKFTLQLYYDRTKRNSVYMKETRDTFDIDIQHSFRLFSRHNILWGAEYRFTHDDIPHTDVLYFNPESRSDNLYSAFIQDRISIIKDRFDLTLGTKLEHNDYSGFEVQPSIRLRFKPDRYQTLWAAVSRAVRTPSRADHDLNFVLHRFDVAGVKKIVLLEGNSHFKPEKLIAYEIGYRLVPKRRFSFDVAAFYNVYHDIRTTTFVGKEAETPFFGKDVHVLPIKIINRYHEDSYGVELSTTFGLTDWWKTSFSYSWLKLHIHSHRLVLSREISEGTIPTNQFSLRSYMDLPHNLQLDTMFFYVDDLPDMDVPSYSRLDIRLGWTPIKNLSLSLKLQNLLDNRHPEYMSIDKLRASEVPRSFYGKVTWHF